MGREKLSNYTKLLFFLKIKTFHSGVTVLSKEREPVSLPGSQLCVQIIRPLSGSGFGHCWAGTVSVHHGSGWWSAMGFFFKAKNVPN